MMKLLSEYLMLPSGIITVLVVLAIGAWVAPRLRRVAVGLLSAAMLMYLVFGSGLTAFWVMSYLEFDHPASQDVEDGVMPDTIVVLAGYAKAYDQMPITGYVNASTGFRLLEASRIFHRTRRQMIIVSGSNETPVIMRDLLAELGVPGKQIVIEIESANTYESAVNLREQLKGKRFYLVTSAGHMPRAMGVFLKQDLEPIPAPTDYMVSSSMRESNLLPNGQHLAISDLAVHEYFGLIWYRLLGRL
jgi:uncharacterized SAM-binding protein YcdF (DUF218 family)